MDSSINTSVITKLPPSRNLKNYLYSKQFKACTESDKIVTHTRIGDKNRENKIYANSYYIKPEDKNEFYNLYYEHIWVKKQKEYLTEMQCKHGESGPILVDFDFKYDLVVNKRQHTDDDVINMVNTYLNELINIYEITEDNAFPIYIFEKDDINPVPHDGKIKDGIHMIIGISMPHEHQILLREKIMQPLSDVWENIPFVNNIENILDESITNGTTPWPLYGSCKPGHSAYKLTKWITVTPDRNGDFTLNENNVLDFDIKNNLHELSAQKTDHIKFDITDEFEQELLEKKQNKIKREAENNKSMTNALHMSIYKHNIDYDSFGIYNQDQLDDAIDKFMADANVEHKIKDIHKYIMILPDTYYFDKQFKVQLALKNESVKNKNNNLFLTYLKFCSKTENFSWSNLKKIIDKWNAIEFSSSGLTARSIIYWAKSDADKYRFEEIQKDTLEHHLENVESDWDIANLLYHMFKDQYVCVSLKNGGVWYEYSNHRWTEIDSGHSLRKKISTDLYKILSNKLKEHLDRIDTMSKDDENLEIYKKKISNIIQICKKVKMTVDKNHIMKEAQELFYDGEFIEKEDSYNHLLGFNNGVYDFDEKIFRDGKPEDYIVKNTKINYVPLSEIEPQVIEEINTFMSQLFPDESLKNYMFEHLATTLHGSTKNQTFNIYCGSGSNGKSMLVDLMSLVLGDYAGSLPTGLITQKRSEVGKATPEVIKVKGLRYVVMHEPSKGDTINEGILKQYTGGDTLSGRPMYGKDIIEFTPQFKLVVCLNVLFDVKSNDDGTWRRIRVVDFMSKFVENPDEDNKFQFKMDKNLKLKFDTWKTGLMAMLIDIYNKTDGNVKDCDIVIQKSNEYRNNYDFIGEFIKEKIKVDPNGSVMKRELKSVFEAWFKSEHGDYSLKPTKQELHNLFENKYGKYKPNGGWKGISIIHQSEDDEENEDE